MKLGCLSVISKKRKVIMRSHITLCVLAVVAILMSAGFAWGQGEDQAVTLTGRYGLSMIESCIETPRGVPPATGFDPNTRALLQPGEALNAVLKGVVSFGPQASVTIAEGLLSDLFLNQTSVGNVPITSRTPVSCTGQYLRAGEDLNFTLDCAAQLPGNLTVTIGTYQIEGLVGAGRRSIIISSLAGNILTEGFSIGGVTVAQRQQVCLLHGALAKLPDDPQK